MNSIIKKLLWAAAFIAVTIAIMYGFWLVLIFWLFGYWYVWIAAAVELLLFAAYFKLLWMID